MIVHKMWKTTVYNGTTLTGKRYWEGWFLFGILPLYIQNTKNEYYR